MHLAGNLGLKWTSPALIYERYSKVRCNVAADQHTFDHFIHSSLSYLDSGHFILSLCFDAGICKVCNRAMVNTLKPHVTLKKKFCVGKTGQPSQHERNQKRKSHPVTQNDLSCDIMIRARLMHIHGLQREHVSWSGSLVCFPRVRMLSATSW